METEKLYTKEDMQKCWKASHIRATAYNDDPYSKHPEFSEFIETLTPKTDNQINYVVVAYRWGEQANHSYSIGVFDDKQLAIDAAESHTTYRGGKYACVVEECTLNFFDNDTDSGIVEIYRTKSALCSK